MGFLLNKVQFGFLYSQAFLPEGFLLLLKLTDENLIMKREKSLAVLVLRWPGVYVRRVCEPWSLSRTLLFGVHC